MCIFAAKYNLNASIYVVSTAWDLQPSLHKGGSLPPSHHFTVNVFSVNQKMPKKVSKYPTLFKGHESFEQPYEM